MSSFSKLNAAFICSLVCLCLPTILMAQPGTIINPPVVQFPQTTPPQTVLPGNQILPGDQILPGNQILPSNQFPTNPVYPDGQIIEGGQIIPGRQGGPIRYPTAPQILPSTPITPTENGNVEPRGPGPAEQDPQEDLGATLALARKTIASLRTQNVELSRRVEAIVVERDTAMAEIVELKKMPATPDNGAAIAQLEGEILRLRNQAETLNTDSQNLRETNRQQSDELVRLTRQLEESGMPNEELTKIRTALDSRTTELQNVTAELEAKTGQLMANSEQLNELNSRLKPLQDDNQKLNAEISRLNGLNSNAEMGVQKLNETIASLTGERTELRNKIADLESAPGLLEPAGTLEVADPVETVKTVTQNDPKLLARVDSLSQENGRLKSAVSKAEELNRSLRSELDDLEDDNRTLLANNVEQETERVVVDEEETDSSSQLALPTIGEASDEGSGAYNISYWILPFLLLGLGIAFYVVLREEFHKRPTRLVSGRDEDRTQRRRQ